MTEKIPSSVRAGSRPRCPLHLLVLLGEQAVLLDQLRRDRLIEDGIGIGRKRRSVHALFFEDFREAQRKDGPCHREPVPARMEALEGPVRVRHHPEDIALLVAHAGDLAQRAVGVVHVAQQDLPVGLQPLAAGLVDPVVALAVPDRQPDAPARGCGC